MSKSRAMVGMLDAGYVQKDKTNKAFGSGYKYASDEAVSRKFRDTMKANGLSVNSFEVLSFEQSVVKTAKGNDMQYIVVHARGTLVDSDGNVHGPYEAIGAGMDSGDKAAMKAVTAARKYVWSQAALVSWGDDPEADESVDIAMDPDHPDNAKPVELSESARNALTGAMDVAPEGIARLQEYWKGLSVAVRKELAGSQEWEAIKSKASAA